MTDRQCHPEPCTSHSEPSTCHSERSEESPQSRGAEPAEILRFAQNDSGERGSVVNTLLLNQVLRQLAVRRGECREMQ
jgi:hypothetical protein